MQAGHTSIVQRHQQELAKLRNGYQAEIDKAIKAAELLRKTLYAKDAQIDLLGATFVLATGGPVQTRICTGVGGSHPDLPWDGKKNTGMRR